MYISSEKTEINGIKRPVEIIIKKKINGGGVLICLY